MAATTLSINGHSKAVEAPADMPLLWVLRDHLGLTGTKFGCGLGQCGACTVLVDGHAQRSCQVPLSAVGTGKITTIEGLGGHHPVQQAWLAEDVAQCGYCQPGQIMQATALLSRHPQPTDREIDEGMAGNICRCGSYQRIRCAIRRVGNGGKAVAK